MKIQGFLQEKIKDGNVVLFFGAGVGQAVGLKGTKELSNYLFDKAMRPALYEPYKDNFDQLVARLDRDTHFQRGWTNDKLCEYFLNPAEYTNNGLIERLLKYSWQSIFTTNYDRAVEYAYENVRKQSPQRLLPIVNPNELKIIQDRDNTRLKYFKLHGCVSDMYQNPSRAEKFVITTKDFSEASYRNKNMLQEFVSLSYNVPVIFIGFNIHKNSRLLESVFEVHRYLSDATQQQFSNFYVALDHVSEDTRFELEDLNISIIDGGFADFVAEVERIHSSVDNIPDAHLVIDDSISITYTTDEKHVLKIPRSEYGNNCEEFVAYHDTYFSEKKAAFDSLSRDQIVDAWKSQPSDMFVFSDRCIKRTQHDHIFETIKEMIEGMTKLKPDDPKEKIVAGNRLILWGERGAGKSVLIRQVCKQIYEELGNPVLFLREDSTYIENNDGEELIISGWNGRTFDKFLSHFNRSVDGKPCIPVLVADQLPHMLYSIKNLYKHLLNHGKQILLILILNESDYIKEKSEEKTAPVEADKEYIGYKSIQINHLLDDTEISKLFGSVKNDNLRIVEHKPLLIQKAKDPHFGKQDLLFILYMWFDERFRRLEDIVFDECKKIELNEDFKQLYLSIAVFQQYNLEPRIDLCAMSSGLNEKSFSALKTEPLFLSLIKLRKRDFFFESYASTRHANFTRKLLNELLPGSAEQKTKSQVDIIERVLKIIRPIDLDFVILLFNKLYESRIFSPHDVIRLKEATESNRFFVNNFILNHQFAAYIIRENAKEFFPKLDYYLGIAEEYAPPLSRSAVIHSKGYLESKRYQNTGAIEHYNKAKDLFARVRATSNIPDEPDYVTEIDLVTERISREKDATEKSMLKIERTALINEAMFVVAPERQNYILNRQSFAISFEQLSKDDRSNISQLIRSGNASYTVLKYYLDSKMNSKTRDAWTRIKEVVDLYYNGSASLATIVILSSFTKSCFILTAEERFSFLRTFFDKIVMDKDNNLNISLVAEYQRILLIDAFILGKYEFIKGALDEYRSTYRHSFPSYQQDEYILPDSYYTFEKDDTIKQVSLFINNSEDFYSYRKANRYEKLVYPEYNRTDNYFRIFMDQHTKFYIRGLRRELPGDAQSRVNLDFCIRFGRDGFRAADIRRV